MIKKTIRITKKPTSKILSADSEEIIQILSKTSLNSSNHLQKPLQEQLQHQQQPQQQEQQQLQEQKHKQNTNTGENESSSNTPQTVSLKRKLQAILDSNKQGQVPSQSQKSVEQNQPKPIIQEKPQGQVQHRFRIIQKGNSKNETVKPILPALSHVPIEIIDLEKEPSIVELKKSNEFEPVRAISIEKECSLAVIQKENSNISQTKRIILNNKQTKENSVIILDQLLQNNISVLDSSVQLGQLEDDKDTMKNKDPVDSKEKDISVNNEQKQDESIVEEVIVQTLPLQVGLGSFGLGHTAKSISPDIEEKGSYRIEWNNLPGTEVTPLSSIATLEDVKRYAIGVYVSYLEGQVSEFQCLLELFERQKEQQAQQIYEKLTLIEKLIEETTIAPTSSSNSSTATATTTTSILLPLCEINNCKSKTSSIIEVLPHKKRFVDSSYYSIVGKNDADLLEDEETQQIGLVSNDVIANEEQQLDKEESRFEEQNDKKEQQEGESNEDSLLVQFNENEFYQQNFPDSVVAMKEVSFDCNQIMNEILDEKYVVEEDKSAVVEDEIQLLEGQQLVVEEADLVQNQLGEEEEAEINSEQLGKISYFAQICDGKGQVILNVGEMEQESIEEERIGLISENNQKEINNPEDASEHVHSIVLQEECEKDTEKVAFIEVNEQEDIEPVEEVSQVVLVEVGELSSSIHAEVVGITQVVEEFIENVVDGNVEKCVSEEDKPVEFEIESIPEQAGDESESDNLVVGSASGSVDASAIEVENENNLKSVIQKKKSGKSQSGGSIRFHFAAKKSVIFDSSRSLFQRRSDEQDDDEEEDDEEGSREQQQQLPESEQIDAEEKQSGQSCEENEIEIENEGKKDQRVISLVNPVGIEKSDRLQVDGERSGEGEDEEGNEVDQLEDLRKQYHSEPATDEEFFESHSSQGEISKNPNQIAVMELENEEVVEAVQQKIKEPEIQVTTVQPQKMGIFDRLKSKVFSNPF